jgi:hypothetical protein
LIRGAIGIEKSICTQSTALKDISCYAQDNYLSLSNFYICNIGLLVVELSLNLYKVAIELNISEIRGL